LSTASTFFASQEHAEVYDALVDWPTRLAHEAPLFRRLFEAAGVKRVLDVACGTGRHATMFHEWGLAVEAADISPAMLARCRAQFGESQRMRWVERSFEQPPEPPGTFDAVVCTGNSLALSADMAVARRAVAAMSAALRPGGVAVVHVLNLWSVAEGPTVWKQREVHGGEAGEQSRRVLLRGLHRLGDYGYIDLVDIRSTAAGPSVRFEAARFMGIEPDALSAMAHDAGGRRVRLFGGYQDEPYDRAQSVDLICVFEK
jgi:SAM-dependent methyltransferase